EIELCREGAVRTITGEIELCREGAVRIITGEIKLSREELRGAQAGRMGGGPDRWPRSDSAPTDVVAPDTIRGTPARPRGIPSITAIGPRPPDVRHRAAPPPSSTATYAWSRSSGSGGPQRNVAQPARSPAIANPGRSRTQGNPSVPARKNVSQASR